MPLRLNISESYRLSQVNANGMKCGKIRTKNANEMTQMFQVQQDVGLTTAYWPAARNWASTAARLVERPAPSLERAGHNYRVLSWCSSVT
jgi:hypothetical protein